MTDGKGACDHCILEMVGNKSLETLVMFTCAVESMVFTRTSEDVSTF